MGLTKKYFIKPLNGKVAILQLRIRAVRAAGIEALRRADVAERELAEYKAAANAERMNTSRGGE